VSGQLHAPAALHPRKEPPEPLDRKLDGPQNWSGRSGREKFLTVPVIQSVVNRCTNYAIPPPCICLRVCKLHLTFYLLTYSLSATSSMNIGLLCDKCLFFTTIFILPPYFHLAFVNYSVPPPANTVWTFLLLFYLTISLNVCCSAVF
jgi:hypothetical protein